MEIRDDKVLTSPSQVAFHDQNKPAPEQVTEQKKEEVALTQKQAEKLAEELSGKDDESPKSVLQHIFDRTQKH